MNLLQVTELFHRNCDALLSLLKCVVGTGCLALPLAFFYVGYVGGIILTIVVTALLIYGLQLLVSGIFVKGSC